MTNANWLFYPTILLLITTNVHASERHDGTAVVRVNGSEYTIPIECNDASGPEHGFNTEPSRLTRQATGRSSGVRLNARPWKDTSNLIVSLDRYVAWVPSKRSSGGVLRMMLDMSPASSVKDGIPVTLTYDMWMDGERPAGLENVSFEANCSHRDPAAPAFRKLSTSESGSRQEVQR